MARDEVSLSADDVALARALAMGEKAALARFDAEMKPVVTRLASRFAHDAGDAWQRVTTHLLVAREDRGPRIAEYTGRGSLRAFVRVVTARLLVDAGSLEKENGDLADRLVDALSAAEEDPETAVLRKRCGEACRVAMGRAMEGLRARQRNVLRYVYVEELEVNRIATLYRVHRATVSRWIDDATNALKEAFRAELGAELGASSSEFASLARFFDSRLSFSLERGLAPQGG